VGRKLRNSDEKVCDSNSGENRFESFRKEMVNYVKPKKHWGAKDVTPTLKRGRGRKGECGKLRTSRENTKREKRERDWGAISFELVKRVQRGKRGKPKCVKRAKDHQGGSKRRDYRKRQKHGKKEY